MQELIKINSDPPERIARLYGIGPAIARKIAEYRAAHGPFRSPEDLAKVDGVRLELAHLLAQQIDWQAQVEFEAPTIKRRAWDNALILLFLMIININLFSKNYSEILFISRNWYQITLIYDGIWVYIWIYGSYLFLYGSLFLMFSLIMVMNLTASRKVEHFAFRGIRPLLLIFLASAGFIGLGNLAYYNMYAPGNWQALAQSPTAMMGLTSFLLMLAWLLPVVLILFKPNTRLPASVIRFADLLISLMTIIMSVYWWSIRESITIMFSIIWLFAGVLMFFITFQVIRRRASVFSGIYDMVYAVLENLPANTQSTSYWLTWINSHLPNTDEQQALKEALDKAYPQSKTRTALNIIVIGSATWLILTSLEAVVQWVVTKFLEGTWPF